jgi:DNA repair protein RadD
MQLRYYQLEACKAVLDYWGNGGGNPLVDLPTGAGKSLVIAALTQKICREYPDVGVLMITHQRELIRQNAEELLRVWPQAALGLNSAGLGRRDKRSKILFAGIQSIARESALTLGERHLIIIDEAHLISRNSSSMYQNLLSKLREAVPDLRVLGLSATPYRMDSGRLDEGKDRLFDKVVFSYSISQGVEDGFLSPLVARKTGQVIDVSGVARRGGEFVAGDLEHAANQDALVQAACDEIVAKGQDRRSWLAFCCGVDHAIAVRDALRQRGITTETVTAKTPKSERDRIFKDFKIGRIQALTGCQVFTTGFNAPGVDLIAMLRPTLSVSLFVQSLGRGTRLAEGKTDCLVLDFAANCLRHGPVDAVTIKGGPKGDTGRVSVDSVRAKACPHCDTLVALGVYTCPDCGHEWEPPKLEPKHAARSDEHAIIMSRELKDKWLTVTDCKAAVHEKAGSKPSLRVEYFAGYKTYTEWVCLEHSGPVWNRAQKWWRMICGTDAPVSVAFAVQQFNAAHKGAVQAIQIYKDGKYWRVSRRRVLRPDGRVVEVDADLNVKMSGIQLARAS